MTKVDFKKTEKELYQPKTEPAIINVPQMNFIQLDGAGDPNDTEGEYHKAVETLYALSYTIKMMPKNGVIPLDYFDYVVPPLEGLWWFKNNADYDISKKADFLWISMIRQPDFVTEDVFREALKKISMKKPHLPFSKVSLVKYTEGLYVQCMHLGSFDDEWKTLDKIKKFVTEHNLCLDLTDDRKHHEIYLSDPRKIDVEKAKTILRYPVRKIEE